MELVTELVNNQFALYIPVALVLVGAILVFTFGFKSAEQPPFDKLSSSNIGDDRKSVGKKRKLKEKKPAVNGHVVNVADTKSDRSPAKDAKRSTEARKDKKVETSTKTSDKKKNEVVKVKKIETVEETKNRRNAKTKSAGERPADFDDGNWETVPAKGDKKKKQDSPSKKDKKVKKVERPLEIEKLAKEVVNKEIQQKEKESSIEVKQVEEIKIEAAEPEAPVELEIVPVEVKKEKKAEKKVKKEPVKEDVVDEAPVDVEVVENESVEIELVSKKESSVKKEQSIKKEPSTKKEDPQGAVAFDELGDVWTEAKLAKKNKKKTRRDN